MQIPEWQAEFNRQRKFPPKAGDILRGPDLGLLKVEIQLSPGKDPFLLARAFSPNTVGCDPAWVCRSPEDNLRQGLLCILLPTSRKEVIRRFGMANLSVAVKSLIIIRESYTEKSLIVEVSEW